MTCAKDTTKLEPLHLRRFTTNEVARAARIDVRSLHNHVARKLIAPERRGSGFDRTFSFQLLVAVSLAAEISRFGVSINKAYEAAHAIAQKTAIARAWSAKNLRPCGDDIWFVLGADGLVEGLGGTQEAQSWAAQNRRTALFVNVSKTVERALDVAHA